ncbi:hypothetical protein C8Q80DRAFT_1273524 [Daedaleopsis nitida]|nr:hypothetical protein C8Q80DRAFT_1273524 [Daedaleopsis nitida]
MLFLTPVQTPVHPFSSNMYSELDFLDSVARQAAYDYAVAHARVEAIQRQRDHGLSQQQQVPRGNLYRNASVPAWTSGCASGYTSRRGRMHPLEDLFNSAIHEQERHRTLVTRQREAQRRHAIAEIAAHQQEAERAARQREAQRMHAIAEITAHQEAGRRARAQRAQAQREALLALSGLGSIVEPNRPAPVRPTAAYARQDDPSPLRTSIPITQAVVSDHPVDRKGKGKAVDIPVARPLATSQKVDTTTKLPTFKEELEARIRDETDPDIQESLLILYSDLFDLSKPQDQQPVAGPSAPKNERKQVIQEPVRETAEPTIPTPAQLPATAVPVAAVPPPSLESDTTGATLHRTPALPPAVAAKLLKFYHARRARRLSMSEITEIEDALRQLEGTFEFPDQLDFVHPVPQSEAQSDEPGALAFSPNNTPLHTYEHALNALLTRLDSVESNGDLEVRGRRKEVVKSVERALEAMERRIEASRERERERSRERARRAIEVPADVEELTSTPEAVVVESSLVNVATAFQDPVVESLPIEETTVDFPETETHVPTNGSNSLEAPSSSEEHNVHSSPLAEPASVADDHDTAATIENSEAIDDEPLLVSGHRRFSCRLSPTPPSLAIRAPEAISREVSTATDVTDATFVTADSDDLPSPSALDQPGASMSETAHTTTPTYSTSPALSRSSTDGEETFLLASTPLAEDEFERKRRASNSSSAEEELEIISREELEAAQKDSDWSDVESDA